MTISSESDLYTTKHFRKAELYTMSTPIGSSDMLPRTNLPRTVDFVGRKSELEAVMTRLSPLDRAWIVSLTGVGGIGKTELAIQAGYIARQNRLFENIVWITAKESWLILEGMQRFKSPYPLLSLNDLLDTIIDVLLMEPPMKSPINPQIYRFSPERKREEILKILSSTSCLLIVDNLETIKDRSVIQFLEDGLPRDSKALITTRLGGLGHDDSELAPSQTLVGQREIRIGPLSKEDAVTLFIQCSIAQGFHCSRKEHSEKLEKIVDKAAYIPLAIEWIVGQMAIKNYDLDTALNEFKVSNDEVLRYCFDSLIEAVPSRAKKVLLAVSVFAESVSSKILQDVTKIPDHYNKDALRRLHKASLIEEIDMEIYSMLAPTRLFVNSLQRQLPEVYLDYYLTATRNYTELLNNADKQQSWGSIKNEQHNIMSLFSWCFDNGYFQETVELAHPLSEYLQRNSLWDQRAYICKVATLAARNLGNDREVVQFTYDAAEILKARGNLDEALEDFKSCEDFSNKVGDKKKSAHAHTQTGIILYHKQKYAESIRIIQQSLEMHRLNDDKEGEAITLSILGRNELTQGDLQMAQKYFEESLKLKQQLNDQLNIAISKYDLGHLYHKLGNLQVAENLYKESLVTLKQLDEQRHQANAQWYYALLLIDHGDLDTARTYLKDVQLIENLLQREEKIKRTNAKLVEVEKAIADKQSIQKVDTQPTVQSIHKMNNTVFSEKAMAIMIAYVSMSKDEFIYKFKVSYQSVVDTFSLLKERWAEDNVALSILARFTEKPEIYKLALEDILQEQLAKDQVLATKLSQLTSETWLSP